MTLYQDLQWRGLIHQASHPEIEHLLEAQSFTVYSGFDPTADSLHVGSLMPILGLARFQRAGHRPIALVGGGTGMIGDPSFKAAERQLLSVEQIEKNVAGIRRQVERFLDFSGPSAAELLNNAEWLAPLRLIDFLRDIGKHFSVNVMLARDSVKQRLNDRDQGISYTEFTYSLLQAYDFLHLYDAHQCRLQIGGSDQWGNIVAGMDLTRRMRPGAETFALTFPLVTKADGSKFGKSETGNVWLDPARTSPYAFYQFWMNQPDAEAGKYLRYFTFLPHAEITGIEQTIVDNPEQREAQRRLAVELTRLVHGDDALQKAQRATEAVFGGSVTGLDDATLLEIFADMPSSSVPAATLQANRPLVEVLVESGVFASKGEAKRMIQNGGLYLNSERVTTEDAKLTSASLCTERMAVVRKGKKNYHLLQFTAD